MTDYGALKQQLDEEDTNNGSSSDTDNDQYSNAPSVNITPEVAIEGDYIVEIGMAGGVNNEQNIRGAGRDGNDAIVTIKNPTVGDGTLFKGTGDHPADYKLVDEDHPKVEINYDSDGNTTGIRTYGHPFEGHEVDDFEEDEIKLWRGSAAGLRMLRVLDCNGAQRATIEDGEPTDGLVEYPKGYGTEGYNPSEDDPYERIAIYPQLRSDMEGEPVSILFHLGDEYNGNAQIQCSVFKGNEDVTADDELEPISTDERQTDFDPNLVWDHSDSSSGNDSSSDDDGGDDFEMDLDEGGTTYSELGDTDRQFVDRVVDAGIDIESRNTATMMKKVEEDNDGEYEFEESPSTLESIIKART